MSETFPKQLKYSSAVLLPRGEDMHVDQVEFKVGQWGLPTENAYHTQLLKYRGNEEVITVQNVRKNKSSLIRCTVNSDFHNHNHNRTFVTKFTYNN